MSSERWDLFRRLCRYYRDCLRLDEHDRLRLRDDHRGDSWAMMSAEAACRLGDGAEASVDLPLEASLVGVAATACQRSDWCCYVGLPVLEHDQGRHLWQIPALVLPVAVESAAGQVLRIRRDGPILPNRAALDLLFADSQQQQACLERLGLVPAELGVPGTASEPSLSELCQLLRQEHLLPAGASDRAVLAVTRRGQYHRRLAEELHLLAEATPDAELDASALRFVFAEVTPSARGDASEQQPLACELPLDPAQRRALAAALDQDLQVVTGPPGTGKSLMVRNLLVNLALRGRSALLASHNHRALDAVEPALNAFGRSEALIVRTSHHGQSRSWQHGLIDLLERGDGDLADPAAAQERFRSAQMVVAGLEADLETLASLERGHRQAGQDWARHLAALPPALRPRLAEGRWDGPSLPELDRVKQELQALQQPGLRRLLPPGEARRRSALLLQLAAWCQANGLPGPGDEASDPASWVAQLTALRQAAAGRECWDRCRDLEQRHRCLGLDRDALLQALTQAQGRAWRAGVEMLVERAAAGPEDPADRDTLNNLRAGVASFGLGRWAAVYRDAFPLLLRQRPLWACTNLSAPATLPRRGGLFDLLVLDEASQCDIPGIIPLLFRCRRVVAVGDPQQLGHISRLSPVQDERLLAAHGLTELGHQRFGYRGTSAWRLLRETPGAPPPILLSEHYRCHPQIASLFNRAFYRQRLVVCSDPALLPPAPVLGAGVHWHEVRAPLLAVPHGACAPAEAECIAALIAGLERSGYAGSLGVTTPFRSQVEMLRRRIAAACSEEFRLRSRLLIATAHGFQGDERDCMFFSLCGGEGLRPGAARFLAATPNLFNVAISRARSALHLVGDRGWAARSGLTFIRELAAGVADDLDPAATAVPESEPERSLLAALAEAGIDALPQFAVAGRRIDLAVIAGSMRLAIEIDGQHYHATAAGSRSDDDCWRDLILSTQGWRVLRFWAQELRDECQSCVSRVLEALRGTAE